MPENISITRERYEQLLSCEGAVIFTHLLMSQFDYSAVDIVLNSVYKQLLCEKEKGNRNE